MKSVKDLLVLDYRPHLGPYVLHDGTPLPHRKKHLEFRRTPKHTTATGAMAALSHILAQANSHWSYADEVARRRFGVSEVEDLTARQIVQIINLITKKGE